MPISKTLPLLAGLLLVGLLPPGHAAAAQTYGSLDEAMAAAAEQHKPLLIDFATEW
jgi:hypothetical protein